MLHVTCDLCGKELHAGEDQRYVVKIEISPARDPNEITEADLDGDHLESVSAILDNEEDSLSDELDAQPRRMRFDLCPACRQRFVRDPLSREAAMHLDFSAN